MRGLTDVSNCALADNTAPNPFGSIPRVPQQKNSKNQTSGLRTSSSNANTVPQEGDVKEFWQDVDMVLFQKYGDATIEEFNFILKNIEEEMENLNFETSFLDKYK
eukprot:Trichotokara_eunicae@DN10005_c0_g1_i1.p1